METVAALLALCAGNSPVTVEFPSQRPVRRSFDVWFALRLNKGLSKQSWDWWFETPPRPLWRHCNDQCRPAFPFQVVVLFAGYDAIKKILREFGVLLDTGKHFTWIGSDAWGQSPKFLGRMYKIIHVLPRKIMSPCWRNFRHWLRRELIKWQLPV